MRLRRLTGAVTAVALVASISWLHRVGEGNLAMPAPTSGAELQRWYDAVGPATASIAMLRVAALALAVWLLLSTLLVAASHVRPASRSLERLARRIAPAALRHALTGATGITLLAATTGSALAATAPAAVAAEGRPGASDGVAVLRQVPDGQSAAVLRVAPERAQPASPAADPTPVPPDPVEQWLVEPGDSCWHIAAEVLAERSGTAATDADVARYWQRLVEANADRFVTGDPDLLVPGQQLVLPR